MKAAGAVCQLCSEAKNVLPDSATGRTICTGQRDSWHMQWDLLLIIYIAFGDLLHQRSGNRLLLALQCRFIKIYLP